MFIVASVIVCVCDCDGQSILRGNQVRYSNSEKSLAQCRLAKKIELHLSTAHGSLRIMLERKTDFSITGVWRDYK